MRRREFLRASAGVLGASVLAACADDFTPPLTGGTVTEPTAPTFTFPDTTSPDPSSPLPTIGDGGPLPTDEVTQPTSSGPAATVYRLSTRNQRSPCKACKAHAAHKFFASSAAADAGRAHPGCTCEVREQRTTATQLDTWFTTTDRDVFDDR